MSFFNLKYSNKVTISKIIILLIILLIVTAVIAFPFINKSNDDFRIDFKSFTKDEFENPAIIEPNFVGVDEKDNTYNIKAKKAIKLDKNNVIFEQVDANLVFGKDKIIVKSAKGEFDNISKILQLTDQVNITINQDNKITSDRFQIDTKNGIVTSESKVQASGRLGSISSDRIKVLEQNRYVLFEGNVRMLLKPENM